MKNDRKLLDRVRETFGVGVPQWRKDRRLYSREEKLEMDKLVDWICFDHDYLRAFAIYFHYAAILKDRGYGSAKDLVWDPDWITWHTKVMRNFARNTVEYVYYDMCCDPTTILGEGHGDGYWIYLDREYQDITHMKVGDAVLNLDEVWAVVDGILTEWQEKGMERERHHKEHSCYTCDRCGAKIYDKTGTRFDVYENLLHCKECAKLCADHWKRIDAAAKGKRRV